MILDGKIVAEKIYQDLEKEIGGLKGKNIRPFLAVVLVGEDPASLLYVKKKEEKAEQLGIGFKLYHFLEIVSEQKVLDLIADLNSNKNIHGIIVQLPLPQNFETAKILASIVPEKDIDGLNNGFPPPTAGAILEILKFYDVEIKNKKIVLVGYGKLVGEPLEKILTAQGCEPLICDSQILNLKSITSSAAIIISGVGEPGLITADMVSSEAIVIDAGTAESSGKTVGDVDESVYEKAASYSPVPGGVGPVTVAMLYKNLIEAAKDQNGKNK